MNTVDPAPLLALKELRGSRPTATSGIIAVILRHSTVLARHPAEATKGLILGPGSCQSGWGGIVRSPADEITTLDGERASETS